MKREGDEGFHRLCERAEVSLSSYYTFCNVIFPNARIAAISVAALLQVFLGKGREPADKFSRSAVIIPEPQGSVID